MKREFKLGKSQGLIGDKGYLPAGTLVVCDADSSVWRVLDTANLSDQDITSAIIIGAVDVLRPEYAPDKEPDPVVSQLPDSVLDDLLSDD